MPNWIISNMQKWTPLSVIIIVAFLALGFIVVWDTVKGIALPPYVIGLLSLLLGGTGATQLINHGNSIGMSNTDSIAQASATAAATTATNIMNAPSGPLTHSGGDAHVS